MTERAVIVDARYEPPAAGTKGGGRHAAMAMADVSRGRRGAGGRADDLSDPGGAAAEVPPNCCDTELKSAPPNADSTPRACL